MFRYIYYTILIFFVSVFISCIPASEDQFDEIAVNKIPLSTGNKWIYDVTRGKESYTDSAEILDYYPYQIDEITSKYLFQYKDIHLTLEMAVSDTVRVKLLEYDNDLLVQYGTEKRDASQSHFLYGTSQIFTDSYPILDYKDPYSNILLSNSDEYIESVSVEEYYIDSLRIISGGVAKTLRDTSINCIKTRNVLYGSSYIGINLSYDLNFYYSEYGILKIDGTVNSSSFSAKAVKSVFN
ncbi:MAG: hypothetical protein KKD38_05345 [Candidatus Delongbacteria bacterium]|nr:hypothetical protein [Candidatus Delongbacteria bacterium]